MADEKTQAQAEDLSAQPNAPIRKPKKAKKKKTTRKTSGKPR